MKAAVWRMIFLHLALAGWGMEEGKKKAGCVVNPGLPVMAEDIQPGLSQYTLLIDTKF